MAGWVLIEDITLAEDAVAIDFASIPQTFTHLWCIGNVNTVYDGDTCAIFNDDDPFGNGLYLGENDLGSDGSLPGNGFFQTIAQTSNRDDDPGALSYFEGFVPFYSNTTGFKSLRCVSTGIVGTYLTAATFYGVRGANDPVTRIRFFDGTLLDPVNYVMGAGSTVQLYGLGGGGGEYIASVTVSEGRGQQKYGSYGTRTNPPTPS